eukprot:gene31668-6870_t
MAQIGQSRALVPGPSPAARPPGQPPAPAPALAPASQPKPTVPAPVNAAPRALAPVPQPAAGPKPPGVPQPAGGAKPPGVANLPPTQIGGVMPPPPRLVLIPKPAGPLEGLPPAVVPPAVPLATHPQGGPSPAAVAGANGEAVPVPQPPAAKAVQQPATLPQGNVASNRTSSNTQAPHNRTRPTTGYRPLGQIPDDDEDGDSSDDDHGLSRESSIREQSHSTVSYPKWPSSDACKLAHAAAAGDAELVTHQLHFNMRENSILTKDMMGNTSIHFAATRGHLKILDLLLTLPGHLKIS